MPSKDENKKKNPLMHLVAGGTAGLVESSICHPLDTIKTRMQLRRQSTTVNQAVVKMRDSMMEPALRFKNSFSEPVSFRPTTGGFQEPGLHLARELQAATPVTAAPKVHSNAVQAPLGPLGTATRIVKREGFFALYKGLSAVVTGIVPKMAIRFVSFEQYQDSLSNMVGQKTAAVTFTAGLASGLTEAVLVVTPAEVCKIRMQGQYHSLMDPTQMQHRKYRNVFQTAFTIVKEEGLGALYKGIVPTMLRQGCNQAVNFTAYTLIKQNVMAWQQTDRLEHWQSLLIGGLSGGMGPLVNNPLDVVKTRLQKQVVIPGKAPKYTGLLQACVTIAREEGVVSLWKGITPRLLRIVPGQAITFMVYESCKNFLTHSGLL